MGKTRGLKEPELGSGQVTTACPMDGKAGDGIKESIGEQPLPEALQLHLDKVLEAITASKEALEHKIESVVMDVNILRTEHKKVAEKVKANDIQLEELKPEVGANAMHIRGLTERLETVERRMEELEGRDRRSNIRLIGLPEEIEGQNMVSYLEDWLRKEVVVEGLSPFFALERAHRVPASRPQPGMPARAVVAKLLHYKDRDTILQKAREHGPYNVSNAKVSMFPDYTLNVQRQRFSFMAVKRELREESIQYALMFPARLRVIVDGTTVFFNDPKEAWSWLEHYRKGRSGTMSTKEESITSKRQRRRGLKRSQKAIRPTRMQAERDKKAAIRAAEGMNGQKRGTESEGGATGHTTSGSDSETTPQNGVLRGVTPRTADDL